MDDAGLNTQLDSLELSNRTRNVLMRLFPAGHKITLRDIAQLKEDDLLRQPGAGTKSVKEVADLLKLRFLHFGMTDCQLPEETLTAVDNTGISPLMKALLTPLTDINPSVRTRNVLSKFFNTPVSVGRFENRAALFTAIGGRPGKEVLLGDVACFTRWEYLSLDNFGRHSLTELETALHERGLALGRPFEEWMEIAEAPYAETLAPETAGPKEIPPGAFIKIDRFDLSVRTRNCFRHFFQGFNGGGVKAHSPEFADMLESRPSDRKILLGDIVQFSSAEWLHMDNFGRKSLTEVMHILQAHDPYFGMDLPDWNNETIAEFFRQNGADLKADLASEAQARFDAFLPAEAVTLEDEIQALLAFVGLKDRNAMIFRKRLGLDGRGGRTLEEVGQEYDVTRERIRQIVSTAKRKFKRPLLIELKTLKEISDHIETIDLCALEDLETALIEKSLLKAEFDLSGIIELSALVRADTTAFEDYEIDELPGTEKWYFFRGDTRKNIKKMRSMINRISSSHGFFKRSDAAGELSDVDFGDKDIALIMQVLPEMKDIQCIDAATGAYFVEGKRNRLQNAVLKCLYVNRPLKPGRIKDGLRRYARLHRIPSTANLLKFCELHSGFTVVNGEIDTVMDLDPEETYSESEAIFISCFADPDDILNFEELKKKSLRGGMNPVTFYLYSKGTPVLESDGNGNFALRGNPKDPFKLDISSAGFKIDTVSDELLNLKSGRISDQHFWFSFVLDETLCETGAFVPPEHILKYLQQGFPITDSDGGLFGRIRVLPKGVSGFSGVFEDKGAEPGDQIIIVCDTAAERLVIEVGSNDKIEQTKEPKQKTASDDADMVAM